MGRDCLILVREGNCNVGRGFSIKRTRVVFQAAVCKSSFVPCRHTSRHRSIPQAAKVVFNMQQGECCVGYRNMLLLDQRKLKNCSTGSAEEECL